MKQLLKLVRLKNCDRQLLLKTAILMTTIRLGLWLLPWGTLYKLIGRIAPTFLSLPEPDTAVWYKVVWAVETFSKYTIPKPLCLARALTTYTLLARQGYRTELRLGVAKNPQGKIEAHAWVESQGQVIIGKLADLSRFTPLPSLYRQEA